MEMPRVTSDCEARHDEHVLLGLGAMGMPQQQQRIVARVPPPAMGGFVAQISMVYVEAGVRGPL